MEYCVLFHIYIDERFTSIKNLIMQYFIIGRLDIKLYTYKHISVIP